MKKPNLKTVSTSTGFCLMVVLLSQSAHAQTSPIFSATFPASWNGTGTTVTDQSSAGNTGFQSGSATYSSGSMVLSGGGGIKVTSPTTGSNPGLLNNTSVASAGGFTYNIDFMWNGTDSSSYSHTEKLVDYAGTESLQLITTTGSATLEMQFGNDAGVESIPVSTTIAPNTWYNVTLGFNTAGNSLVGGDISGTAYLLVNGSLVSSGSATKGAYGDNLHRPIGIGEFGYGHTTSIIGLNGDISSASIELGTTVPEPSTVALGVMGGVGVLGAMWKARRRQA